LELKKQKKLVLFCFFFSLTLEFLLTESLSNKNIFLLICFILLLFLMRSTQNQSKYYSSFWVESLPVLWWILLLVFLKLSLIIPLNYYSLGGL